MLYLLYYCALIDCRKVAKKIFVGSLQPDETVDANHEASLLRNLDHPNIVRFFDSFIEGEFFCILTEYCEVVYPIFIFIFAS
jgi:serine/threonine protein kinase